MTLTRLPLTDRRRKGVSKSQLDKRLPADTDPLGLPVNRAKQVDRKIDVHALDLAARSPRFVPIDILVDRVRAGVEELVKLLSRNRAPSTTFCVRTRVFRATARGGPR